MTGMTRTQRLRAATRRLKPDRGNLASDLVAALTFAVVNVPQAMGHALLAMVHYIHPRWQQLAVSVRDS